MTLAHRKMKFNPKAVEWTKPFKRGYPSGQRGRRVSVYLDGDVAELVGIHLGDGCLSITRNYQEYALSGDLSEEREYLERWVIPMFNEKVAIPLLGKPIKGKPNPINGVYGFHIFNPKVVQYFIKLGLKHGSKMEATIPPEILRSKRLVKRLLRGLFDTDGTIYFEKNYSIKQSKHKRPKIKIGLTSPKLALQVKEALEDLGFHPMWKKPYKGKRDLNPVYSIVLHRKSDIQKWFYEVGFKNPKHQTKLQIWREFGSCPPKTKIAERKKLLRAVTLSNLRPFKR